MHVTLIRKTVGARRAAKIRWLSGLVGLIVTGAAAPSIASDPENCLFCHQFRGLSRLDPDADRVHVYFVDPDMTHGLQGPHARLACTACHPREEVAVVPHAPVTPVNCTRTCHLPQPGGLMREFSHRNVKDAIEQGVHKTETLKKLTFAQGPLLGEDQSACLYCHDEPVFPDVLTDGRLEGKSLERCETCHTNDLDVDLPYVLRHISSRLRPARSTLELAQTCAVCHSDPVVVAGSGSTDTVASYLRSFHGKAALLGDATTANCLSCHAAGRSGVHALLPHDDPASPVHPARVASSCRTTECHPAASPNFASTSVHLDLPSVRGTLEFLVAGAFILITLFTFGPSALFAILELLQSVVGRHHVSDARMNRLASKVMEHPEGRRRLKRFTAGQRIQHWVLAVLFVLLVITGFPLKFADTGWARAIIQWFGGLQVARTVHHWAGVMLLFGFLGHLGHVGWNVLKRSRTLSADSRAAGLLKAVWALPMWINFEDIRKLKHSLQYWFFLRPDRPAFGRFSLKEKFEYIGVFWGTMLLGLTGLMLWGEQFSSYFLSGQIFNIAAIAHTYEAFLAVIHVGVLHTYSVILSPNVFPISLATITGDTPVRELAEGHAELVEREAAALGIHSNEESIHG